MRTGYNIGITLALELAYYCRTNHSSVASNVYFTILFQFNIYI